MSIKIMSAVYDSELEDIYDVSVMLALANHADDEGVCYPSIARICKLSRCKTRKAQNVIRSLSDRGYLKVEMQAGPKGANRYILTPAPHAPRTVCTPHETTKPPHDTTPPPHDTTSTPAHCAPETLGNVKKRQETSLVRSSEPDPVFEILSSVDGVQPEAASSFIAYRKKHKSKALTETAANRLATHLYEIFHRGGDPTDALGMAEERGWASVQPDWYFNSKGQANDPRNPNQPNVNGSHRGGSGPHHGMVAAFAEVAARGS